MDDMATTTGNSSHPVQSSTHTLDAIKMSQLAQQQVTTCINSNNSHNTSCGNVIMVESSLVAKPIYSSVMLPLTSHSSTTILPPSNKLKAIQKSTKGVSKITVSASNLQRIHKAKPTSKALQKNCLVTDIDDDLGNILDIPIIFAKDDDNLNSIERNPPLPQVAVPVDVYEKNASKLLNSSSTRVVLISNKQDKLHHQTSTSKLFVSPCTRAITCPNVDITSLNHAMMRARAQNPAASKPKAAIPIQTRTSQPTIKYTKIILAKRNSQPSQRDDKSDKNERVVVTKAIDKINTPKLLNHNKDEHKYARITERQFRESEYKSTDETLEIEDAIKMNIIERKCIPMQRVDSTSPTNHDNANQTFTETKVNIKDENILQRNR